MRWLMLLVALELGCGPDTPSPDSNSESGATTMETAQGADSESTGATPCAAGCAEEEVCAEGQCVTPGADCPDPGCPELCRDGLCVPMTSVCVDPGCGAEEVCVDPMDGRNPICAPYCDSRECGV